VHAHHWCISSCQGLWRPPQALRPAAGSRTAWVSATCCFGRACLPSAQVLASLTPYMSLLLSAGAVSCPAGSGFNAADLSCTQCAAGQASAGGNAACQACAANTYTAQPGSSSCSACVCTPGPCQTTTGCSATTGTCSYSIKAEGTRCGPTSACSSEGVCSKYGRHQHTLKRALPCNQCCSCDHNLNHCHPAHLLRRGSSWVVTVALSCALRVQGRYVLCTVQISGACLLC
jgi:hypothetical protein